MSTRRAVTASVVLSLTAFAPARTVDSWATERSLSAGESPASPAYQRATPVPDGTPTRQYAAVPANRRVRQIELVEDLVIGGADDPREAAMFYSVSGIAVDATGRIFVAEERGLRVSMFDAEGVFLGDFGRPGEGPGDFQRLLGIAVVGDAVVVEDRNNTRFSVWSRNGEHRSDHRIEPWPPAIIGGTDQGLVVCIRFREVQRTGHRELLAVDLQGNVVRQYFDLTFDRTPSIEYQDSGIYDMAGIIPRDRPSFAATRAGRVYGSPAGAYQVVAKSPGGASLWALSVDARRIAFEPTPEQLTTVIDGSYAFERLGVQPSDINWPEYEPVIERLEADDHGNLYVFPWAHPMSRSERRAVDVYSPDGERIFAGLIRDVDWEAALGDYVYAVDEDPATGEERVVRFRLTLPEGK